MPTSTIRDEQVKKSKTNVAVISIIAITLLIVIKFTASIYTGSIGIRADAIHSIIDLSGAIIGFIGIRVSEKYPDERHPYGHGKAENIASAIIAGIIFLAAGTIFFEAVNRIGDGSPLEMVSVGIWVTAAAIVINGVVSFHALRVARATDSMALEATSHDMLADVMSSVAVLIGLVLVKVTGLVVMDAIVALIVALLIFRTALLTMKKAISALMDTKIPAAEEEIIRSSINEHIGQLVSFHKLRTRKSGNRRYIDLHLVFPKSVSISAAHELCDHLEEDVKNKLDNADITIHAEPCDGDCEVCKLPCSADDKKV